MIRIMGIVITGNPGVGKHTISQQIAQKMKLSVLDINEVAKDSGLFGEENGSSTNDIDVVKLGEIMRQKILGKDIIVGHLAPYVIDENQIKIAIVLRRSPYDLVAVYKDRGYSDKKIRDNAGSEILGIIANDAIARFGVKTFQINVSSRTVEETAEKIIDTITGRSEGEDIDWLDLVRKNNDLGKFFAD